MTDTVDYIYSVRKSKEYAAVEIDFEKQTLLRGEADNITLSLKIRDIRSSDTRAGEKARMYEPPFYGIISNHQELDLYENWKFLDPPEFTPTTLRYRVETTDFVEGKKRVVMIEDPLGPYTLTSFYKP